MIIYGWKQYAQVLAVLQMMCSRCGNHSEHVLRKLTTKVTLFWIPLFPISRKHTLFCPACESEERVPKEQALAMAAGGPQAAGHLPGHPPQQPGYAPPPVQGQQFPPQQQFPQQPAFAQSAPQPYPPSGPQPFPPSGPQPGFAPQGPQPTRPYPGQPQGQHQGPPPGYPPQQYPPQQYPPQGFPPQGHPPR